MNPNDPNPTPVQPISSDPAPAAGGGEKQNFPEGDELFVITPPQKKPLDKKSVAVVITLSIIGVILMVAVLIFALIGSASGLADDYRRLAFLQINKIDKPLGELAPGAVLNERNLDSPGKAINLSKQSLPSLESVLFVGGWSERYTQTETLQKSVSEHYQNIDAYNKDLKELIAFDNALEGISEQEPNITAIIKPADSLTIRSAGGTYDEFAKLIKKQAAPRQLTETKKELTDIYQAKSAIYLNWAALVESGNKGGEAKAKADLLAESAKVTVLLEDESFIDLFKTSYAKLVTNQKALKNRLAG